MFLGYSGGPLQLALVGMRDPEKMMPQLSKNMSVRSSAARTFEGRRIWFGTNRYQSRRVRFSD